MNKYASATFPCIVSVLHFLYYKSSRKSLFCYFFFHFMYLSCICCCCENTPVARKWIVFCFPLLFHHINNLAKCTVQQNPNKKDCTLLSPNCLSWQNEKQDITKLNKIARTWQHTGGYSQIFYRAKGNTSNDRYMH